MLNIILPMAGLSSLPSELEYPYPSPLAEINERPLIQYVIQNLSVLDSNVRFIVILRDEDCRKFHLDSTIKLLAGRNVSIVKLKKETAGALCSILLAVDHFQSDSPLVIANADQIFDSCALETFMKEVTFRSPEAACPVFESVHPRWSYVHIENNEVVEAAEKNPISKNAVAGLYYFRSGSDFIKHSSLAILNGRHTNGRYYTSAVLNEYILAGLSVIPVFLAPDAYHSLYTAQRLLDFAERTRATVCSSD